MHLFVYGSLMILSVIATAPGRVFARTEARQEFLRSYRIFR
jgi:hypothetical protein